jgi:hypothetical protein
MLGTHLTNGLSQQLLRVAQVVLRHNKQDVMECSKQ